MMLALRAFGILVLALAAACSWMGGPSQPATTGDEAGGTEPVAGVPATPPSKNQSAAKAAPPSVKTAAKGSTLAKNLEPPLDVAALKTRLRETNAIGVFTKLALKNQMDDLLEQFRAHYQGGEKTSVASLRQPYDMLVLKVLSLVQDSDPSLARTIAGSREAIWGILADKEKFNSVT
jgi:hypothetical protein